MLGNLKLFHSIVHLINNITCVFHRPAAASPLLGFARLMFYVLESVLFCQETKVRVAYVQMGVHCDLYGCVISSFVCTLRVKRCHNDDKLRLFASYSISCGK